MKSIEILEKINKIKLNKDKEISKVYKIDRPYELSDKEKEVVKEIFTNPEMFSILRKALNLFTFDELGIERAYIKTATDIEIDERIRSALIALYQLVKVDKNIQKEKEIDQELKDLQEQYEQTIKQEKENKELEKQKELEQNPFKGR